MLGRWVFSFFGEIKNFDEGKLGDQVKTKVIVYGNYTLWVQVLNHKYIYIFLSSSVPRNGKVQTVSVQQRFDFQSLKQASIIHNSR